MPSIFELIPAFRKKRVKLCIPDRDSEGNKCITLLEIDATLREVHTYNAEPTENPIEDGSTITDHVNIKPRQFQMDCMISNNPLSILEAQIGNAAGLVGGIVGRASQNNMVSAVATGGFATLATKIARTIVNDANRVTTAIQKLTTAWEGASPLSVENALTVHKNMIIKSLTLNRDKTTADVLSFSIMLQEVRFVNSRVVRIPKESVQELIKSSATSETDNGRQPSQTPTDQQSESWLQRKGRGESLGRIFFR